MQPAFLILNGVNVTESAQGIETLTERIYYDSELRGYLREIGGEVTLTGDVFRFIQNRFKTDFDNPIPASLSVYNPHSQTYETVFNGVVFPADCEFDLYANSVVCQLVDSTFFAKIENNKNLKFTINAGLSKMGVDISSRGGDIDYAVVTGLFPSGTLTAFSVTKAVTLYQALDYLVAAMTDGDVQFFSTYLADDPTHPNFVIMSGEQVRAKSQAINPRVTWVELFGDLSKQFNLLMAVEEVSVGVYRIRVEPFDFWKQQSVTALFEVKPRVKERADISELNASVLVGSAKINNDFKVPVAAADGIYIPSAVDNFFNFMPRTPFQFHLQEEYNFEYLSNVDSNLNLRCSILITDTEIYQYQASQYNAHLNSPDDIDISYEEDVFLIESTEEKPFFSLNLRLPETYSNPTGFLYINDKISNANVLINNVTQLPASASAILTQFGSQSFRIYYTPSGSAPTKVFQGSTFHCVMINDSIGVAGDFVNNTTYIGTALNPIYSPSFTVPAGSNTGNILSVVAGFNDNTPPGFDTSNSPGYDTTNFYWTCDIPAFYTFRISLKYIIRKRVGTDFANAEYMGMFLHWDSTGTILKKISYINILQAVIVSGVTVFYPNGGIKNSGIHEQTSVPFNMIQGDVMQVILFNNFNGTDALGLVTEPSSGLWLRNDSYLEISGSSLPDAGGTAITIPSATNFLVENELEGDVPADIWAGIRANPFGRYTYQVSDNGEGRTGFLKDFSREIISGKFNGLTMASLKVLDRDNLVPILDDIVEPEEEE
jgi:hypothetical protein